MSKVGFSETILHVAIKAEEVEIAKELIEMMSIPDLEKTDCNGHTALSFVAFQGRMFLVEPLVNKNPNLLNIVDKAGNIPLTRACGVGLKEMTDYLYLKTSPVFLDPGKQSNHGFHLIRCCIANKMFGLEVKLPATANSEVRVHVTDQGHDEKNSRKLGGLAPDFEHAGISSPALQMQRELQWFKEVEKIVPEWFKEAKNENGETPKDVFTKSHRELVKEREKWMRDTSGSFIIVSILLVTIMFAVAFTVPGGLMFLGILTSRQAEEDFHVSLPKKLMIGLFTLFVSIATMMASFCAALLMVLQVQRWALIFVLSMASIPITLFVWSQFPLLVEIFVSTYASGIFKKKTKRWLIS
ncbi:hypothetical protein SLEP1_g37742 [Rubroshorea leprosula]|uniref:PGG domain-containing protein n=1 Tax=Rubroshorea leprosula TaxID=152421 RepID=A0AAV5KVW9_9ROSI|nr:hypothetical protein SLEP1_g37742 [Rubroshorea leprosula]